MTTAPSIHSRSTPPAPQQSEGTVRGFRAHTLEQTRHGASSAENVGRPPSRRSAERERPEDDEAVITAVLATVIHRSTRERPEDDEVILTYTSEPACRHRR
ncbi:hypothetical protein [Kocuria nitroreducens]|uniref:hypothetical protein n=1 Tax=Kocuria nitroreducens TaxID=3058914 RepID=UPI0036DF4090